MTSSAPQHSLPEGSEDSRVPQPRRRTFMGAALGTVGGVSALALSACGKTGSSSPGGGSSDAGGSPSPTPEPRVLEALPDRSAQVPDAKVTDLSHLSTPMSVSYPRLPVARGISEALDVAANKILREHRWAGHAPEQLTVSGRVFASSADALGAVLLQKDPSGDSASVVYYRAAGDRAFTSPGLIAPEQWKAFGDAVLAEAKKVSGLDAAAVGTALQEQPRPWGNGPTLVFAENGDLHVVLPAATISGKPQEVELKLTAAAVKPMLSEDGTAILAAAKGAAFNPKSVQTPGAGERSGDKIYVHPESVPDGKPPRKSSGVGPQAQLAPLSGEGVRPSPVAAPDASRLNAVALSFDDGPSPELNTKLRGFLDAKHASVTFFMIGRSIAAAPQWCTKTAVAGFEVGEHSWSHPQLSALHGQRLQDEVTKPSQEIEKATGRPPFVMRPPYGAHNSRVDEAVGALGQSVQIWDVDTLDWKTKNVAKNIAAVQKQTHRGSIILMHEIHPTSVDAVPQILDWLEGQGHALLTCSEIGQNQMWAGKYYMMGLVTHSITPPAPKPSQSAGTDAKGGAAQKDGAAPGSHDSTKGKDAGHGGKSPAPSTATTHR